MSILDSVKDLLDPNDDKSTLEAAQDLLGGGLSGVREKFESSGLGDKFKSWTGQGDNEEFTPEDVKKVFGAEKLKEMAEKHGTDSDSLLKKLSGVFPKLVDKVTPNGEDGADANIVETMKGLLGKIPGL